MKHIYTFGTKDFIWQKNIVRVISLLTFLGVLVVRGVCVNVLVGDVILNVQSNGLLGDTEITISSHLTMQGNPYRKERFPGSPHSPPTQILVGVVVLYSQPGEDGH